MRTPAAKGDGGAQLVTSSRATLRRALAVRNAAELLAELPGSGEAVHVVYAGDFHLADVFDALIERLGRCDRATLTTLGYNRRNLATLLGWIDSGAVGALTLLASKFFTAHNEELAKETREEFGRRPAARVAFARSHVKIAVLRFADGHNFAIEGSANLCGSGSRREQFVMVNDAALCDWHAAWIEDLVAKHASDAPK